MVSPAPELFCGPQHSTDSSTFLCFFFILKGRCDRKEHFENKQQRSEKEKTEDELQFSLQVSVSLTRRRK